LFPSSSSQIDTLCRGTFPSFFTTPEKFTRISIRPLLTTGAAVQILVIEIAGLAWHMSAVVSQVTSPELFGPKVVPPGDLLHVTVAVFDAGFAVDVKLFPGLHGWAVPLPHATVAAAATVPMEHVKPAESVTMTS
jgi:hypothetical protein